MTYIRKFNSSILNIKMENKIVNEIKSSNSSEENSLTEEKSEFKEMSKSTVDNNIPKEEIEFDMDHLIADIFTRNVNKIGCNISGPGNTTTPFEYILNVSLNRSKFKFKNSSINKYEHFETTPKTTIAVPDSTVSIKRSHSSTMEKDIKAEGEGPRKRIKFDESDQQSLSDDDEGRLVIDWEEPKEESKVEPKVEQEVVDVSKLSIGITKLNQELSKLMPKIDKEYSELYSKYQPYMLRLQRFHRDQKMKRDRSNLKNLDLNYHSNMARNFPGTEQRTSEQKERREKNTVAARISRAKNKAQEKTVDENSAQAALINLTTKRRLVILRNYATYLMHRSGKGECNFEEIWEQYLFNQQYLSNLKMDSNSNSISAEETEYLNTKKDDKNSSTT